MQSISRSSITFYTLGPLFCALVRENAIFAVCKRCANKGFTFMCREKGFLVYYTSLTFVTDIRCAPRNVPEFWKCVTAITRPCSMYLGGSNHVLADVYIINVVWEF